MVERKTLNLVVVGSIPTGGVFVVRVRFPRWWKDNVLYNRKSRQAALAQLGERKTEDLEVPGSIPGGGIILA